MNAQIERVAVLGGGGAMGGLFGAWLHEHGGADVALVDVAPPAVSAIAERGLKIQEADGCDLVSKLPIVSDPSQLGQVDLIINFVKCYHTEAAISAAKPILGDRTTVLTLQNGWGNAERIGALVGAERVVVGLTYHSASLVEPGVVKHPGSGKTFVGEVAAPGSARVDAIAELFNRARLEAEVNSCVLDQIWKKLALNCCTLPTSALLRFHADQLIRHDGTTRLMQEILDEVVAVATAQDISLSREECWEAISGLLRRAVGGKSSMLQDVEAGRRTEIEVINGAIVEAGRRTGVATKVNEAMMSMIASLQESYLESAQQARN